MKLMAEWDWLGRLISNVCVFRGAPVPKGAYNATQHDWPDENRNGSHDAIE